jgi:hypothetical protein
MSTRALARDFVLRYIGRSDEEIMAALRDPAFLASFPPYTGPLLHSDEERLLAALIACPCQLEVPLVASLTPEDFSSRDCAEIFVAVLGAYAEDPDFELVDVGMRVTAAWRLLPRLGVGATTDFEADGAAGYAREILHAAVERGVAA